MGKRRTRKDKIIAQLRRQVQSKSPGDKKIPSQDVEAKRINPSFTNKSHRSSWESDSSSLFSYDPGLIRKDLLRTMIWSTVALLIELGLYIFLR